MNNNTLDNNLLTYIEQKTDILGRCSCLLSLDAMSLSMAVDVCRTTKYFEMLLEQWQQCLPLGEAGDVNFASWGAKMWDLMNIVRKAYYMNKVEVNLYEYESESYVDFKAMQQVVPFNESSQSLFQDTKVEDIPVILICALRDLNEVLMEISEFLNSPTEELIEDSWRQWYENFRKHYLKSCQKEYGKWKISFSPRTLRKHLEDRRTQELESFKMQFLNDDEFEQVFDLEQMSLDIDGLSRFLFTHTDRFGVSYIDERPRFSNELLSLFCFVELWAMMENDLPQPKKRKEKVLVQEEEVPALPDVLHSTDAMKLWEAARMAGWVDENCQPKLTRTLSAVLADHMATLLRIRNKWKVFEAFWKRNNMRADYNTALDQKQYSKFHEKMKRSIRL